MHVGEKHEQLGRDTFRLVSDRHGVVRQPCWFCNEEVEFKPAEKSGDAAVVMIEVVGPHERMHGVCHTACGERSKGALARW